MIEKSVVKSISQNVYACEDFLYVCLDSKIKLERTVHNVFLSKKKCIFMGDTNINTLTKMSVSKEYINHLIQSEGLSQLIFEATRITENSQSCIDHIFTNISTSCSSGSLAVEIADPIYQSFLFCTTPNLVPFLITSNSDTFEALKVIISN